MANMIFNLDLNKNNAINPIIFGRLTDGNLRKITVNITNEGEPINLDGWVIRFEGVTGGHAKIFDVMGVNLLDAQNGKFEYTFSKTAFSATGAYKNAYFAIEKDGKRETTNDIKIIVEKVADINAKEAETVVTELNKTITLINSKYNELNSRVNVYEGDIADLENWISARKTEINTVISNAETTFNQKLTEIQSKLDATNTAIQNGDFYSKTQIDGKITTVNSAITTHTNNKNNPHAVTAGQTGAYTKAETDTKLALKANDSQVVHLANDETISGKKTFNIIKATKIEMDISTATVDLGWGMSVTLTKKNGMVFANGTATPTSNAGVSGSFDLGVKAPDGFRPLTSGILMARGNNAQWANYIVTNNGSVQMATGGMNTGYTFYINGSWIAE